MDKREYTDQIKSLGIPVESWGDKKNLMICESMNNTRRFRETVVNSAESKKKLFASPQWELLRSWCFSFFPNKCCRCGKGKNLQVDHIVPVSREPMLALDFKNVQLLCSKCNAWKFNAVSRDFRKYVPLSAFVPSKIASLSLYTRCFFAAKKGKEVGCKRRKPKKRKHEQ